MKSATLIFFALWAEPDKINYYPVTPHHARQIPTLQGPSKVIPMFLGRNFGRPGFCLQGD